MKVVVAPSSPHAHRIQPDSAIPAPRPLRPALRKAHPYASSRSSSPDAPSPRPSPKPPEAPARPQPLSPAAAVPWRKTPLPPYQPRSGSSTQTLLEMQLERRLDNLPDPETLTAACWQQLDSINRKDAARLLDKVANGTMVLRLGTVHALAAQNWSRPRMRQFLCWLLYIDRGLENVVTYTDAAKLCLQDLLYKMDLEEAQIYIDLSQLQQRGFQLKACTMFSGWDEGAVQLNGAAVAAFRQGMFTDRQRLRSYLRWLIGLDGAGAPYHNVRLTLTKDGAQALFRFLQERNDYDLWDLARCRLPHMDWDLTPQGSSEERPSRAPGARPSPAPGAPHRS